MSWYVYMIRCDDDSLYTGITDNVARRVMQHAGRRGAKYFRGRQPAQVVYLESGHSRRSAARREAAIKKMRRRTKDWLIASASNALAGER
jgi:putative endonuclease